MLIRQALPRSFTAYAPRNCPTTQEDQRPRTQKGATRWITTEREALHQYAHEGLFAMAAAHLFHIARNHPFVDGNKRTALLAALVFLDINGITVERESEALYELTMGVAEGRIDKAAAALELLRAAGER